MALRGATISLPMQLKQDYGRKAKSLRRTGGTRPGASVLREADHGPSAQSALTRFKACATAALKPGGKLPI
jgi:hypothetical protein